MTKVNELVAIGPDQNLCVVQSLLIEVSETIQVIQKRTLTLAKQFDGKEREVSPVVEIDWGKGIVDNFVVQLQFMLRELGDASDSLARLEERVGQPETDLNRLAKDQKVKVAENFEELIQSKRK